MTSRRFRVWVVTLVAVVLPFPVPRTNEPSAPSWRRIPQLSDELAAQAQSYVTHRAGFTAAETVRSARYRSEERNRTDSVARYPRGLPLGDETAPEFRLRIAHGKSRPRKREPGKLRAFPSAHDWATLFSDENQPFFMFRELGTRLEGFDLVREIRFRGALPFTNGHDIREWEGGALVEANLLRVVEVRARPRNQEERMRFLHDRWSRSFKFRIGVFAGPFFIPGPTLRLARRPLAYRCFVRFDDRRDEVWLPTLVSYEVRRPVPRERTVLRTLSTRHFVHTRKKGDMHPPLARAGAQTYHVHVDVHEEAVPWPSNIRSRRPATVCQASCVRRNPARPSS
jgi:hypothetical protein